MINGADWLIILNPLAIRSEKFQEYLEALKQAGVSYRLIETERKRHGADIAMSSARAGETRFLAVGGDGMLHDVINGLMSSGQNREDILLGQIPMGTANDWFRSSGLPYTPSQLARTVKNAHWRYHDIGEVTFLAESKKETRFFITTAGVGFDAVVADATDRDARSEQVDRFQYLRNIFRSLKTYQPIRLRLKIDDQQLETSLFSLNIGNSKYTGGGMRLVPHARPDDGKLDVTLIRPISRFMLSLSFPLLYTGLLHLHPAVQTWQAETVSMTSEQSGMVHLDGEISGKTPVEITVVKEALRVLKT